MKAFQTSSRVAHLFENMAQVWGCVPDERQTAALTQHSTTLTTFALGASKVDSAFHDSFSKNKKNYEKTVNLDKH